jgi:hypothetical protein
VCPFRPAAAQMLWYFDIPCLGVLVVRKVTYTIAKRKVLVKK